MEDKDGYRLLEKEFESRGFNFSWIKDLSGGWKIYKKTNKKTGGVKFELIKPIRNEETNFGGNLSPKRWSYPGDAVFGRLGFDCFSLERAIQKHAEIMQSKEDPAEIKISIPASKTFTITEICNINPSYNRSQIYNKIQELIDARKVKCLGEDKNHKGKGKKPLLYAYQK